jgi:murein DD-endopeptidase MepM/ murein hydrolase activator NlpD
MSTKLLAPVFAVGAITLATGSGAPVTPARAPGPAVLRPTDFAAPLPEPVRVVRGFAPPATRYGPGHLGVDLRAGAGAVVHTAAAGVVRFAGQVAGRGLVVVAQADGITTEYEPLQPLVRAGTRLPAGAPVGVVHGRHPGCPGGCLHWGAQRGGRYIDPLGLLRPLGPVVLLPWPPDG